MVLTRSDYKEYPPLDDESAVDYCGRLEEAGCEEMWLRKALQYHFDMQLGEFPEFFKQFELARFRHIALLKKLRPERSDFSLILKLSVNLEISREQAQEWVQKFNDNNTSGVLI